MTPLRDSHGNLFARWGYALMPRLLLLGLLPLLAACFVGTALEIGKSQTSGSVQVTSATLGNHELAPNACVAGERQVFLGADFVDGEGITTRLIVDPEGAATLRLFDAARPLEPGVIFRRGDCERFELSIDRTGWRVNDVHDLRVRLDFDCRAPSGDAAKGSLVADHCH